MSENQVKRNSLWKDLLITIKAIRIFNRIDKVLAPIIFIQSIFSAVGPYIMIFLSGLLLDALYRGDDRKLMIKYAIIGVTFKLVVSLIDHVIGKIKWTKYRSMHQFERALMSEKLMEMDYEYIEDESIQHIVRKQTEYSQSCGGVYTNFFTRLDEVVKNFVSILIAITVVIPLFFKMGQSSNVTERVINSPLFSVGMIGIIGFGMWASIGSMKKMQEVVKENQEKMMAMNKTFFYYFSNFLDGYEKGKDVRMYHLQNLISSENENLMKNEIKRQEIMKETKWKFELVNQPISTLTGGLVYLFAGLKALVGAITIGNVIRYAGTILQFITSFSQCLTNLSALRMNNLYMEEMLYFLSLEKKKEAGSVKAKKTKDSFVVEFRHVYFAYPGTKEYVIKDLNMQFKIGSKMAIVGRNGSGKTTFIKLLCRLYEPTKGEIYVNGVNIKEYDYDEYLKLFSVVFQDTKMYSFALGNNVAASQEVDEDRVVDAISRAGLKKLLDKMPKGIHTYIYKDFDKEGVEVSGGEAQRIAIARAIYKDRPYVIMDEPTAALDPIAEYQVYTGFNEMVGNKTAVYISHRLSSCRFCDDIAVFEDGNVVQRGNHQDLLREEGLYRKMWDAQAQYYADSDSKVVFQ